MSAERWTVTMTIVRYKQGGSPHEQSFSLEVDPAENVLDVIERIWAFHDRDLTFRHACHHSTCGACGMRVNGVEKLTCITPLRAVVRDGGQIRIEPLRNFPLVSDLVVDMSSLYTNVEAGAGTQIVSLSGGRLPYEKEATPAAEISYERLADCIECGLCVSACPVSLTTSSYYGPAALAAAHQAYSLNPNPALLDWVDSADGVWRCHSGFECTAVCPSNVDPAWRIMDLRKRVIARKVRRLFGLEKE